MRIVDLHTVHTGLLAVQQDCTLRITTTATAGGSTVISSSITTTTSSKYGMVPAGTYGMMVPAAGTICICGF